MDTKALIAQLEETKATLIKLIALSDSGHNIQEVLHDPIIENNPDCLKILDLEGKILFMNYNGLCQMEIDNLENIKDKDWCSVVGPDNTEVTEKAIKKAVAGETTTFKIFSPTVKGHFKWWNVVVSPLGNPVNQILAISKRIN